MAQLPAAAESVEQELMQEIHRRFRNKEALYAYLTTKTVSSKPPLSDVSCRCSSCPARSTAPSSFSISS